MHDIYRESTSNQSHRIRELEQELEIKNEILKTIEEQSQKNETFSHHQKELVQENLMFKDLVESLEEKSSEELGHFFSMISHELKTPLVPIQGYVKLLKEKRLGNLDKIQLEKLDIIDSNTTALSNLIQSMLDYQKLSTGVMEMKNEKTNIKSLIENVALPFEDYLRNREIKLEIECDDKIEISCDAKRISQVLSNIVNNSLQAVEPKKGMVKIGVMNSKNLAKFTVRDNGCGIPEDQLDKVFTKFYQVDMSNTRERGGIGIGLSICQKIVEAHNGEIWIESHLGKDTTVNFTLPKN